MLLSLFLHILFYALSIFFSSLGVKQAQKTRFAKFNVNFLMAFLFLFLFIGLRYNLGRDWVNYDRIFTNPDQQLFIFGETREFGFLALIQLCHILNIDFQGFVMIMTIITLSLFFSVYNKFLYLLPAGVFIFLVDLGYASIINLMRQTLAIFAFMCAMSYSGKTDKKSLCCFFSYFFLGVSFHYTILLFLPCWFIDKVHLSLKQLVVLCIFVFSMSFMYLADVYEDFMSLVPKYEDAYTNTNSTIINEKSTFGLGAILLLVVRLFPLFYYNVMLKEDRKFAKYYILYYFGLSVYYGFYNYLLITRFTFYFQFFELIIMPYFLYKTFSMKNTIHGFARVTFLFLFIFNFIYLYSDFINDHVVTSTFSLLFIDFTKEPQLL